MQKNYGGNCCQVTANLWPPCRVFKVRDEQGWFAFGCLSIVTLAVLDSLSSKDEPGPTLLSFRDLIRSGYPEPPKSGHARK